jgi:hypothetical protein
METSCSEQLSQRSGLLVTAVKRQLRIRTAAKFAYIPGVGANKAAFVMMSGCTISRLASGGTEKGLISRPAHLTVTEIEGSEGYFRQRFKSGVVLDNKEPKGMLQLPKTPLA